MIRLVIVEDEPYMADYLTNYIDWSKINIKIEAVSDNGADGLAVIRELCPDIVITDIKMPQMDGLTMIKNIISEGIDCKIVILSSYSEFHIVKEAFKLGITDYILKAELDEETINRVFVKLINSIAFEKKNLDEAKRMKYKRDRIKAFIVGTEKISDCDISLRIKEKNLSVAVIKLLDYATVLKDDWNMEDELLKYGLLNVMEELLENEHTGEVTLMKEDEFAVIISDAKESNSDKRTREIVKSMCRNIENVFGFSACSGWCGFEDSGRELKKLYDNAKCAVDYTFVYGHGEPLNYNDIKNKTANKVNVEELILSFSSVINKYDINTAVTLIDDCMNADVFAGQLGELHEFCDMCCLEINKMQKQLMFENTIRSKYKKIMSIGTLNELKSLIKQELYKLSEVENENVALIPRVKKYIDDNYYKKISLEYISEKFNVGYQKLSREFKRKTGVGLKKYIIEVRMNEAMRLIVSSEYMLYEIAEMVGYANYENFSRVFYAYFKKWPKEIERP